MKRSRHSSRSPLTLPMNRGSEVVRARRHLQQRGWPRLQMALIVALTGAAGFLASHLLRLAGIDAMWFRYPMAVVLAYGVFLLLMWIWIRWRWDNVLDGLSPDVGGGCPSLAAVPWNHRGRRRRPFRRWRCVGLVERAGIGEQWRCRRAAVDRAG